ncbi:MAG: hypothetical protein IH576_02155 [Deltaproteobacteria bacterium]|nr:hypothetical protein [Deltaproteobacteria bacterium]
MGIEETSDRIAEELHKGVELQRGILRQLLSGEAGLAGCEGGCPLGECEKISRMKSVLKETIEVLEETKSAFKSKRLEVLRRKLIEVLAGI